MRPRGLNWDYLMYMKCHALSAVRPTPRPPPDGSQLSPESCGAGRRAREGVEEPDWHRRPDGERPRRSLRIIARAYERLEAAIGASESGYWL
jgi:hypothetical protein